MRCFLLITIFALSGCAALSGKSETSTPLADINVLPPQTLAPGECGFFAWSMDPAPRLIFFAKKDKSLMIGEGGQEVLTPLGTDLPAREYQRAVGANITLELGESEVFERGTRYPEARMRTQDEAGWERLMPIAALRTCQPQ